MIRRPKKDEFVRPVYDAKANHAQCNLCPLSAKGCLPVRPEGGSGNLIVVESYPDTYSEKVGQKVQTQASEHLEKSLATAGATDYVSTWALLCRPPKDATPHEINEAIEACRPRLEREIEQARLHGDIGERQRLLVLALGEEAFRATTTKVCSSDAWRGSPVQGILDTKVIPTWEPGLVRSPKGSRFAYVWQKHINRAVQLSTGRLGDFVWPESVVDDDADLSKVLGRVCEHAREGGEVSVDIETRGLGLDSPISCIGFASDVGCACIQLPFSSGVNAILVRNILANGIGVGQNFSAFDRQVLKRAGYELTPMYEDTLLAASILDPQLPKNLGALASYDFHAEAHKAEFKSDKETGVMSGVWNSTDPDVERDRRIYCLRDAYITLLVWRRQKERLAEYGWEHYQTLKKLDVICQSMSDVGMEWDFEQAAKLKAEYEERIRKDSQPLVKFAEKLGLPNLNLASPAQLRELYFGKFRMTPIAWSDKGTPQLSEDVLTVYISGDNPAAAEFSKKLLDVRESQKLAGSYINNGPESGKTTVHSRWKATGTVTGRFSAPGFGMQTIPAIMRPLLKAPEGYVLTESDMSQLEIRLLAVQADIRLFRETYDKGGDVYLATAARMFNKPDLDKNTPEGKKLRQLSKTCVLSCNYMAGDETVFRTMYRNSDVRKIYPDLSLKQVAALRRAYLQSVPELAVWWGNIMEESGRLGYYAEKVSDRRVYFYGPVDGAFIASFRNQSLAAYLMNKALLAIDADLNSDEQIRLQCHDSIVMCGPDGARLEGLAKQHMTMNLEFEGRQMHLPCEYKTSSRGGSYGETK